MIFNQTGIDTKVVLNAAGTKWNFLPFTPGSVRGHCIGVDPCYPIQKAKLVGYHPDILIARRRIDATMCLYTVNEVIKLMIHKSQNTADERGLILSFSLKENCKEIRNTRVIEFQSKLKGSGARIYIYNPWADLAEAKHEDAIDLFGEPPTSENYDAVVVAVTHDQFKNLNNGSLLRPPRGHDVISDIKGVLPSCELDGHL